MTRASGAGAGARAGRTFRRISSATLILGLATLAPSGAIAQQFSFTSVSVVGSERIDAATVLSYAGISQGQVLTAGQLNDAYQRVVASGLFETVEFEPRGGTLVITVTERPVIGTVAIEGNRRLNDDRLLALIQSRPRQIYSPAAAQRDAAAIVAAYESAGRLAATVRPTIIRRGDDRVDLVFEVSEGGVVEVERISIVGNEAFSDARLRRVLATKQAGIFRAIVQRDTLIDGRLDLDRTLLTDFYNSRGYPDFRVVDITSELSRERDATFITFVVEEGQRYSFGEITATSTIPGLDAQDFLARARIRPGTTYSPEAIDTAIRRMEALALSRGLDFVQIEPQITRDDAHADARRHLCPVAGAARLRRTDRHRGQPDDARPGDPRPVPRGRRATRSTRARSAMRPNGSVL
jgi:outer membrane protein insertion porin family